MGVVLRFKWDAKYKTLSRLPDLLCVPGKGHLLQSFSMEEQNQQREWISRIRQKNPYVSADSSGLDGGRPYCLA